MSFPTGRSYRRLSSQKMTNVSASALPHSQTQFISLPPSKMFNSSTHRGVEHLPLKMFMNKLFNTPLYQRRCSRCS